MVRRKCACGAGWELLFYAIDDHTRIAFTQDENRENAHRFFIDTHAYYCSLAVRLEAPLTDSCSAFRTRCQCSPPALNWTSSTV